MSIQNIRVSEIVLDSGIQVRSKIRNSTVAEYSEAMRAGAEFPPIIVFHDGNRYLCADGFHRTLAAARIERDTIKADVRQGSKQDALKFALSANVAHGLRRTNADKRQSVGLALTEWPTRSNRWIAEVCAVHHEIVAAVRVQLEDSSSSTANSSQLPRTGSDGRTRRLPQRPPASRPVPSQAAINPLQKYVQIVKELANEADSILTDAQRREFADELSALSIELQN